MSERRRRDVVLCVVLMACGLALGSSYVRITREAHLVPVMPDFSRRVFGAAAMSVCGYGLRTPEVTANASQHARPEHRPLLDFIGQRRERLACADIPADQPAYGLDGMQRASGYLMQLVVGTWAVTGLTWSGIDYLQGAMFGASVGLTYLIGRLAMGSLAATVVALVLLLSPIQLTNLYDLRDYAKAPFFLASLLVAGFLITRHSPPRVVVGWCAAGGALLGFGFGIRTDVVVNLVLLVGVALACLPGRLVDTWRLRLGAAVACLLSFGVVALPILTSQESGSNLWHWALLGYAHEWDWALSIIPGPYEPMYFYSDSYVATTVNAFAGRMQAPSKVTVGLPGYPEASRAYYELIFWTFPADALLRGWAAVIQTLDLPFGGLHVLPQGILPDVVTNVIGVVGRVRVMFAGLGVAVFSAALLMLSIRSVRLAASLFGVVAFLGAYPAIQFQLRHVFHLELLSVWMLGVLASAVGSWIVDRWRAVPSQDGVPAPTREGRWRPVVFAAGVVATVTLPMAVLRGYQQRTATTLMETYVAAPLEALTMSVEPAGPGMVRLAKDALPQGPRRSMRSDVIVAEVSAARCPVTHTAMRFSYDAGNPDLDFTRTYDVEVPAAGDGVARVFVPVYRSSDTSPSDALKFGGVEIAEAEQHCITGLSRWASVDHVPLLMPVVLLPGWRERPLHQSLRGWERDGTSAGREPATFWGPAASRTIVSERLSRAGATVERFAAQLAYAARIARVAPDARVDVAGVAEATGSYLAAWQEASFADSDMVLIEGELNRGGLAIGLTDRAGWATRLAIDTPGPFTAVIQAPRPGQYQLVIANHLSNTSLWNRLTISRIAILRGEP